MWALRPQAARLFLILSVSFEAPALPGRPGLLVWCLPSGGTAQAASHAWHLASAGKSTKVSRPLSGSSEEQHPSSGVGHMVSLADVALHRALTPAAGDVAAPVVLAVTSLHHSVRVGVVAAPTAHEVAAVTAVGSLVALPGGWEQEVSGYPSPPVPAPPCQVAWSLTWWLALRRGNQSLGKQAFLSPNFPVFPISLDRTLELSLFYLLSCLVSFIIFFLLPNPRRTSVYCM
jgi:hypothetical protein